MKKLLSLLCLVLFSVSSAFSITLKEAFEDINSMPDLKGVENDKFTDILGGWIGYIPVDEARITAKLHQVGSGQTVFYGSKVEEIRKQLPQEELILGGADYSNLIYFYAKPIDKHTSELLIMIDQAYQGKTTAVYCKVNNRILEALKRGKIEFTPNHQIVVNAPLLICD